MPYRRLPNTDQARIRALKVAINKGCGVNVREIPFSLNVLSEARNFLQRFEVAHRYYTNCYEDQIKGSGKHQNNAKMARMYITHFIQVLNMAVMRSEIHASKKELYDLPVDSYNLPDLNTDALLAEWGAKIIEGERKRTAAGGVPIYNPTIAKVKVHYDIFMTTYEKQKALQTLTAKSLHALNQMRAKADELILHIWTELEGKYADVLPNDQRLAKCREFGVIYYYRTGEKRLETLT